MEDRRRNILSLALILVVSLTFSLFSIHYYRSQYDTAEGESSRETAVEEESPVETAETGDHSEPEPADGDFGRIMSLIDMLKSDDDNDRKPAMDELVEIGEPAVPLLLEALDSGKFMVETGVMKVLGEIGDPRAVEPLIVKLEHKIHNIRRAAVTALGKIGSTRSVEPLIDVLLYDKEFSVREESAKALGKIGDSRAVEALVETLDNPDTNVRKSAVTALGEIGDPRAVEPLMKALDDEHESVREAAAIALEEIRNHRTEPFMESPKDDPGDIDDPSGKIDDALSFETCIDLLGSYNKFDRETAVVRLGEIGGTRALEPLIDVLKYDKVSWMRGKAATALGKIGDPRAVEPLIEALGDENMWVRRYAAEALEKIGDPRAVEPLTGALKDESRLVRERAAEALGKLGNTRAVEPLIETLKDEEDLVRYFSALALGEIGDSRAVRPLKRACRREENRGNPYVLKAIDGTLEKLSGEEEE